MTKGRVLVVDDDPDIRAFVELALEDEGYEVASAVDGEALVQAREQHPDVILLDLMMPGMDGVEVSRRLRDDPATAAIPVIVMSAHDRIRALAAQMAVQDRLPKPFQIDQMYATVARWRPAAA
jgi:CheY-like chemotaxis protein